jgi:hypothetical protein
MFKCLVIPFTLLVVLGCGDRKVPASDSAHAEPPPAAATAEITKPTFANTKCNSSFTPEQCAVALHSLERDAKQLANELASQRPPVEMQKRAEESQNQALQDATNKECADGQTALEAMRRMQSPAIGEKMSKEDIENLPKQIEKLERFVASNCR